MGEKSNQTEYDESKKPLLSLEYSDDGTLSGYITHLRDMKHIFVTENYEYVRKMNAMASTEVEKPLAEIKKGSLALVRLVHTFSRVKIVRNVSKTKSQVVLIDTGHELTVENSNLYIISKSLSSIPPLAMALELSYTEIYPEALARDLNHLIGAKIMFKLDENNKSNTVRIKDVSIFNSYLNSNISYYGSIVHNDLFNKNQTSSAMPQTLTFVHNSVATEALPSLEKERVTSPIAMIIPVLVFFMIFGSIGFIVAKFMNDKKKSSTLSTTITIRPKMTENPNNSIRSPGNNQIQGKQESQKFGDIHENTSDIEAIAQAAGRDSSQSSRDAERLKAGISMLSSIHQLSSDHGHYYRSSADTTFNNPFDHSNSISRVKTFPKRSTPINGSVKSSMSTSSELAYATSYTPEELSRSGIMASFANTHEMFQNMTVNSNRMNKSKQLTDDSYHSSTSR